MDIALKLTDSGADLAIEDGDLALDAGLRTAVLVSLFSDARIPSPEELPYGETNPRGWWADTFENARTGSLLWTIERAKITTETINTIRDSIETALAWLLEGGIVDDVQVTVTRLNTDSLIARIEVTRGQATQRSDIWDAIAAGPLTFETPTLQVQLLTT